MRWLPAVHRERAQTVGKLGGPLIGLTPANGTTAMIGGNIAGNSISTTAQFCGAFSSPRNSAEADSRVEMPRDGPLFLLIPIGIADKNRRRNARGKSSSNGLSGKVTLR